MHASHFEPDPEGKSGSELIKFRFWWTPKLTKYHKKCICFFLSHPSPQVRLPFAFEFPWLMAAVSGAVNCPGCHLILSAEIRVFPHQNEKPFFGFPPYSDPGNVRLCFGIIWYPISFTSVRFKRSAHDLLKFFVEYQTHHLLSSQQQAIVSSLPKSVVSFPTNHTKWCPIVSTWCSLVSSIQYLIYLPENRTVNLLIP